VVMEEAGMGAQGRSEDKCKWLGADVMREGSLPVLLRAQARVWGCLGQNNLVNNTARCGSSSSPRVTNSASCPM
jgi:hypothetical protein